MARSRLPMVSWKLTAGACLALALAVSACSSKDDGASPVLPGFGNIKLAAQLKRAGSCDEVLGQIRGAAEAVVGPYGLPGTNGGLSTDAVFAGGPVARGSAVAENASGAAPGAPATPGAATKQAASGDGTGATGGSGYSSTNVQEVGIDEPDLVKTDGKRILVVADGSFHVVDIAAPTPKLAGTIRFTDADFFVSDLLVSENRALVFGNGNGFRQIGVAGSSSSGGSAGSGSGDLAPGVRGNNIAPGGISREEYQPTSLIAEIDLTDNAAPKLVKRLETEGQYVTARQVGSVVRVVVQSFPQALPFLYPQNENGEASAKEFNKKVIRDSTLDQWLPFYRLADANNSEIAKGRVSDCTKIDLPSVFSGFGTTAVLTFDLKKTIGSGDAVSVLAGTDTVYASDKNLYIATTAFVDPAELEQRKPTEVPDFNTSIHTFDIGGSAPASYVASGIVPGHLLNQFSMSEYEGHLRAATTNGAPWAPGTESVITVLKRNGDRLDRVGQVGGMGKGERIYAVRYVGPTAYVVTFRQTDPFYTVDLSNPAAPKVVGELKIPGYSGYLHPIDKSLVLGIGQDATAEGRRLGAKVSLFDVSDLANPKELSNWSVPGSQTDAEYDHHAFLYWPESKIAVLPLLQYPQPSVLRPGGVSGAPVSEADFFAGAIVLSVDRAAGIKEIGRITHAPETGPNKGTTDCRKVSAQEIAESATGIGLPPGALVLACDPGTKGGATGYECSIIPAEVVRQQSKPGVESEVVKPGGHIELCYDPGFQQNPIQRTLVAAGKLWTISPTRLQANSLTDFSVLNKVAL